MLMNKKILQFMGYFIGLRASCMGEKQQRSHAYHRSLFCKFFVFSIFFCVDNLIEYLILPIMTLQFFVIKDKKVLYNVNNRVFLVLMDKKILQFVDHFIGLRANCMREKQQRQRLQMSCIILYFLQSIRFFLSAQQSCWEIQNKNVHF